MDNVTHALAGCLIGAATIEIARRRTRAEPSLAFRRAAYLVGVITAELPDADLVYAGDRLGMGSLGYLLHHRGHTHTVLFALVAALVVWLATIAVRPSLRARESAAPLLGLALVGTLSHIALDFTNSYGVHPWWPLDNRWFYGDAVFIIEPWLFVAGLPPLFLIARSIPGRVLAGVLLALILGLAWRVDMVSRGVAVALTIGAVLWFTIVRMLPEGRRAATAVALWIGLECMFFVASGVGRGIVERSVGETLRDVVLTPAPGNPFCLSGLTVTETGDEYAATSVTVAPFASVHPVAACSGSSRTAVEGERASQVNTSSIRWGDAWTGRVSELRELAHTNCEVAAGLRFMRVPVWRRGPEGRVTLFDQRFSDGGGGFASIVASASPSTCPRFIPPWKWPRADILGPAP
ncbi:MAG: metal-dependent hydrolase [Cytophagaceae bacterium]|nr:metal-dependent hydrolase [Gemmatimonadaceae bacterium]